MEVTYAPQFKRKFKKLSKKLQEEGLEKIILFAEPNNHSQLQVHKLKGRMDGRWSFSVNYRYRIVFTWQKQNESAILLTIGDHSLYE